MPSLGTGPETSATLIDAVGFGLTVIVLEVVAVHPLLVTVTVYVPATPVVIPAVIAPVLHK
jgi:hypothetical protein